MFTILSVIGFLFTSLFLGFYFWAILDRKGNPYSKYTLEDWVYEVSIAGTAMVIWVASTVYLFGWW